MKPEWDDQIQSFVVRRDGPWIVSVTPMIFNDRIVLTHERQYPHCYTAGYCYDKGGAAFLAAAVWDPITELRPVGYKKIACEDLEFRAEIAHEMKDADANADADQQGDLALPGVHHVD